MRMLDTRLAGLGLVAALFLSTSAGHAQTTLRYKFTAMDKLSYVVEQKMTMKIDIGGKVLEMGMNQILDMLWVVQSVDKKADKAKMTQKFERLRFSMDSPMGKIDYDSKDGKLPNDAFGQALKPVFEALAGLEVGLTMDVMGEISDVTIPEGFLKAIKEAGGGAPGISDMFSPEGLKKMMGQAGLHLPKEAVKKDKSWAQKVPSKVPFGEMRMDNSFTYDGPTTRGEKKLEQIKLKTAITLEPDPNAPVVMKLKDGAGKGIALFDNEAGHLHELAITQTMTLEAAGQNIEITQVITMKLK